MHNIPRSQGNQAIEFSQLIQHNTRDIFIKKSYTNYVGDTIPRPFSKKAKLSISLDQYSQVSYSLFLWYAKDNQNTLKLSCRLLAFTSYKTFLKNKRSGTRLPVSFSA